MNKRDKIIVTGYKGQLGFDLVNELKNRGFVNILGIDKEDLDITHKEDVDVFLSKQKPKIIIHCAAWTDVDKGEQYPEEVYKINALGTKFIALAAKKHHAKMVYISTDYVFNGNGNKPFEINSQKNGLSVYGKSKADGEDFVQSILKKYFIIRVARLFGINGNNFIKKMIEIADSGKKEIYVVNDQIGSPTYTKDLSRLISDMIETEKYGIYHCVNNGYCSYKELAEYIFEITNLDIVVNGVSTEEYLKMVPNQAKRPLNGRLSTKTVIENGFHKMPTWQDAVYRYIREELNR